MEHLSRFSALADHYDGFILDLWGVIHDGVRAFPQAIHCLDRLRSSNKPVLLLSNVPRPNAPVRAMMRRMGIEDHLYTAILTSGEAVRQALIDPPDQWWANLGPRVFHLGPDRDRPILDGLPREIVRTPEGADFVLNTGPDDNLDPTALAAFSPVLRDCARNRLPMICANPDLEVLRGGVRVLCAGALAVEYRELGGDVCSIGKPDPTIYRSALRQLGVPAGRVLAVGDALGTDIAGAAGSGLDSCWVLGGLHGAALVGPDGRLSPGLAEQFATDAGLRPVASIPSFTW